jgi:putative phosphoribosyl transferase
LVAKILQINKILIVIFKDRIDAGQKLGFLFKGKVKNVTVVSLLRGGAVIGYEVAKILKAPHLALPVSKISSPTQVELAIGALCFDEVYLDRNIIASLGFDQKAIVGQIEKARIKFASYLKRFNIKKSGFKKIKNKVTILVDDGIATGATIKAGALFLKTQRPLKVIAASPIAPKDLSEAGFDEVVVYHRDPQMSAISRFYREFPQLEDNQIKKLLKN